MAAALRERELLKTRTLTPAQLCEKTREEWLALCSGPGSTADKAAGAVKGRERGFDRGEDNEKAKDRSQEDDDFSF
jgi:hypothetical protein